MANFQISSLNSLLFNSMRFCFAASIKVASQVHNSRQKSLAHQFRCCRACSTLTMPEVNELLAECVLNSSCCLNKLVQLTTPPATNQWNNTFEIVSRVQLQSIHMPCIVLCARPVWIISSNYHHSGDISNLSATLNTIPISKGQFCCASQWIEEFHIKRLKWWTID